MNVQMNFKSKCLMTFWRQNKTFSSSLISNFLDHMAVMTLSKW